MDLRTLLYLLIGLAYVAYPLYYLTSQPSARRTRVLGLGLMVYGLLLLLWPGPAETSVLQIGPGTAVSLTPWNTIRLWLTVPAIGMMVTGFAVYLTLGAAQFPWILALAYGGIVLAWPEAMDSLVVLAAALLVVVSFERCLRYAQFSGEEKIR